MKITIDTKNITLDEPLRVFVEQKIGGLGKYLSKDTMSAQVEIGKPSRHHRSGLVFRAEVNIKIGAKLLRAEASHADLRTAIDNVRDELQLQIKKFKEKQADKARRPKKK